MSKPDTILPVLELVRAQNPERILDVGCGDGFYGMLFRRYLADGNVTKGRGFHLKATWKHRIDAIEIFPAYITPAHKYIYDFIYDGKNAVDYFKELSPSMKYDLIFMGDLIEHLDKATGRAMIDNTVHHLRPNGCLLIVTPRKKTQWNESPNDNPYEAHKSLWDEYAFDCIEGFEIVASQARVKLVVQLKKKA
jgi:2-polyprenyl-3-methyl-5-hydroxy-6-metoxy-1,4-benzoquinol methylase